MCVRLHLSFRLHIDVHVFPLALPKLDYLDLQKGIRRELLEGSMSELCNHIETGKVLSAAFSPGYCSSPSSVSSRVFLICVWCIVFYWFCKAYGISFFMSLQQFWVPHHDNLYRLMKSSNDCDPSRWNRLRCET